MPQGTPRGERQALTPALPAPAELLAQTDNGLIRCMLVFRWVGPNPPSPVGYDGTEEVHDV